MIERRKNPQPVSRAGSSVAPAAAPGGGSAAGRATPFAPSVRRQRGALGFIRIPKPAPGERFGWTFEQGDRLAFDFNPDAGDGRRFEDRVVFRIDGGEVTLLGPCDSASLAGVSVRLPDGSVMPLETLVSDDETIDRIAETLLGESGGRG
ncbi:MAG: hypothetical protein RIB45_13840 [Marivibrio sp.]|uniref:hypothetical protein n=1 Tax=Marivibrio sp. TaxID=2039719 RepID=UPI0032ED1437